MSAKQGAHSRHELRDGEGLCEIVVGARIQPPDAIAHQAARREHQDRSVQAEAPHLATHAEAVHVWQHHVKDQQVVGDGADSLQRTDAVHRHVGRELRLGQCLSNELRDLRFVFNDQDAHVTAPLRGVMRI